VNLPVGPFRQRVSQVTPPVELNYSLQYPIFKRTERKQREAAADTMTDLPKMASGDRTAFSEMIMDECIFLY
jgi:hypothetical protein